MSPEVSGPAAFSFTDQSAPPGPADVVEVSLLISAKHAAALELAAHRKGLTAAQMVRRLLSDFISSNQYTPDAV